MLDRKYKEDFGTYLKRIRNDSGYTQEKLAEKTNIPKSSISGMERGTFYPKKDNLNKLSEVLGVSVEELQERKDESKRLIKLMKASGYKLEETANERGLVIQEYQEEYMLNLFRELTKQERREVLAMLEEKLELL